jgi:hypothetical protein
MTDLLKLLLNRYGLLYTTIVELEKQRPGTKHASLAEYYESLGQADPGEPVLAVRISQDGETRFLRDADPIAMLLGDEYKRANVTILELPEDEFYFFQAFRPAMFHLEKNLPNFLLGMALVYAYALFETYVADIIRLRLRTHPAQLGPDKQVSLAEILGSVSKEALIDEIVDRQVNQLLYEPIRANLERLRNRLGLRAMTTKYDQEIASLSLVRNCLIHNAGRADPKLVAAEPSFCLGQPIEVQADYLSSAIDVFRKCAAAIDAEFEQLRAKELGSRSK